ncbi:MAG: efflux RND transporter periplasmic adaptor subunit [Stenotrophomonas sp.]|uniref:efflux RND transporter periplasmic adaptor subunit n=1 Tax=Stenotrophomonas sp. TaxID=69392 RepID=UPI003D6D7F00
MTVDRLGASASLLEALRIERPDDGVPKTWWRRPQGCVLLASVVVAVACACSVWVAVGAGAQSVRVETVRAAGSVGRQAGVLDASGYVVARRSATVSAQVTGMLVETLFEEADHVAQGQLLARLDANSARAALEAALRQVAAAQQVARQYEVQLAQAERDRRRAQELGGFGLVSAQAAEQAVARAKELQAQLASQRGVVEAAKAQAEVARVHLAYTEIRAPFSGVITSKAAQVGEIISPGASSGYTRTGVASIVDMESLEVEVEVGEAFIARVVPSMAATVIPNAYPELQMPGQVIAIIPTADRGKATVRARIALKQRDARILPDMGVRIRFIETEAEAGAVQPDKLASLLMIPKQALQQQDGQTHVFVVDSDLIVRRRDVVVGSAADVERVAVEGLVAGERVVLNPSKDITEGDVVAIAETR